MGLDMYLSKSRYFSDYNKNRSAIAGMDSLLGGVEVNTISGTAIYWRKSNQIHNWFVENVQGGDDECQESHVSYAKLLELSEVVTKVLDDNSLAEELLPNASGFFFGGQEYDEYYFQDLEETKKSLDGIFKDDPVDVENNVYSKYAYAYQASW